MRAASALLSPTMGTSIKPWKNEGCCPVDDTYISPTIFFWLLFWRCTITA